MAVSIKFQNKVINIFNGENMYLYRFFPIANNWLSILERDGIVFDEKSTLQNILAQRLIIEKKSREFLNPDVSHDEINAISEKDLLEPYFSLYRINYLLNNNCLWTSKVEAFNDVFEKIKWTDVEYFHKEKYYNRQQEERAKKGLSKQSKSDYILELTGMCEKTNGYVGYNRMRFAKHYGVASFCKGYEHPQMWALYANGHHGLCVRFKVHEQLSELFFSENEIKSIYYESNEDGTGPYFFWGNVIYQDLPEVWSDGLEAHYKEHWFDNVKNNKLDATGMMLVAQIFHKDKRHNTEDEFRMIVFGLDQGILLDNLVVPGTKQPYLIIDEVYFGSEVESDFKLLLQRSLPRKMVYRDIMPVGGTYNVHLDS